MTPADWRNDPVRVAALNLVELAQMHDAHARHCSLDRVKFHRAEAMRCRSDAREMMEREKS